MEDGRRWVFIAGRRPGQPRRRGRLAITLTGAPNDEAAQVLATLLTRLVSELAAEGLDLGPRGHLRGLLGALGSACSLEELEAATGALTRAVAEILEQRGAAAESVGSSP